jgi:hypothetical protein
MIYCSGNSLLSIIFIFISILINTQPFYTLQANLELKNEQTEGKTHNLYMWNTSDRKMCVYRRWYKKTATTTEF